jgi:hypothetical protein
LTYAIKLDPTIQENIILPYFVELEAVGYLRYVGDDNFQGVDRFRAIRFTGYQMLYGAMREMLCNLTARSRHGIWQLPARSFHDVAREQAENDEKERLKLLERAPKKMVIEKTAKPRAAKRKSRVTSTLKAK